ncbi:MAG: amidase [Xanthobacteraceae bacterium]|uniref:amidase n=1 Tax=Pseudolabrys sp. TaxID=1960880 RepID=UPI003D0D2FF3
MLRSTYRSAFVPHDIAAPIYGAASGPLAGLTAAVKDMYDIAGYVAGCGNPTWLATHQPAASNAGAVQAILDAGAAIIGKTICDELFYSGTGANHHYGTPINARAPGRLPGGSSAGSAAAVGAGLCDFALGSDTAGSVRVPASFNGIYGLRPTHGRIDLSGVQDMAASLDVPGWFAATPGIFRNVGAVLLDGRRASSAIQRVVMAEDTFEQADPAVNELLRTLLEFMADDLPPFTHSHIAPDGFDAWREAMRIVQAYEVWQAYGEFVTRENPEFGPGVRERMAFAASITGDAAAAAAAIRAAASDHIRSIVTLGTVLALPSAPSIAPRTDTSAAGLEDFRVRVMRLACISSISGLPQVSIPAGTVDGCPVGLSFIGWEGGDEALLDLAYVLSRHCGMAA